MGESSVTLVRMAMEDDSEENTSLSSQDSMGKKAPKQESWDNKIQYILAQIGFAVGLGNVWRFPYLCQKYGGGAFLIPYGIMLILEGLPLFYLELAIGQRLKKGSVGIWNYISPWLGGLGVASMVVCFLVALFYNMIIAWALWYLFNSFKGQLPWDSCDSFSNTTIVAYGSNGTGDVTARFECEATSATQAFFYRNTLEASTSMEEPGHVVWWLAISLLVAWIMVFIGMFKGITSSGKVVYFSATFPYIILVIFFVRSLTLEGASDGIASMFNFKSEKLIDIETWVQAATQIFFSLGLGFGGVPAYSSYNDVKNNCKKDALIVTIVNCGTSLFASIVVYSILGFKAFGKSVDCFHREIGNLEAFHTNYTDKLGESFSQLIAEARNETGHELANHFGDIVSEMNSTVYGIGDVDVIASWNQINAEAWTNNCSIAYELDRSPKGAGLAFIAFTEAMTRMEAGYIWSILFFVMLINLGLGSMFGTLEGIITPLSNLGLKIRKEIVVGVLCVVSYGIGMIFTFQFGNYILTLFDMFVGNVPLLLIALLELVAVSWIYGYDKFASDIEYMLGSSPGLYWRLTWKFISPLLVGVLFGWKVYETFAKPPEYDTYDITRVLVGEDAEISVPIPGWAIVLAVFLVLCSLTWIPTLALLRKTGVLRYMPVDSASKAHPRNNGWIDSDKFAHPASWVDSSLEKCDSNSTYTNSDNMNDV